MREVYRDRWLLVVDKPAGLPTQRTRAGEEGLYERLAARLPYVGLHHRLDRPASGLVLFTLDNRVNRAVTEALRAHELDRRYLAVLYGDAGEGVWEQPVDGRPARSEVRVLGRARGLTAVEVRLITGRKHQIRLQSAMSGTPVVGDRRYGGSAGRRASRLALHAWRLAWKHPQTGELLELEAPLPEDLRALWAEAGGPSSWGEDLKQGTHLEG